MGKTAANNPLKRASKACNYCRKKKIKCNGILPCINCINYKTKCVYVSPPKSSLVQKDYGSQSKISKLLIKLSGLAQSDLENNQAMMLQIDTLNDLIDKSVNMTSPTKDTSESFFSKETALSESLRKNRYSKYSDRAQLATQYFGLYSPISLFSQSGMTWFTETIMNHSLNYKLNLFSKPELDFLLRSRFLKVIENVETSKVIWSESPTLTDLLKLELDEESFLHLINNYYNDQRVRCYVSKSFLIDLTTDFFKNKRSSFVDQKYLILFSFILCSSCIQPSLKGTRSAEYLRICLFIYKSAVFSVKTSFYYLIGLVQLLASVDLKSYPQQFETILSEAIEYAFKLGLNRKELYVGLSEIDADLRRNLMWELYITDKKYYLFDTKRIFISDDDMSCTYPNSVAAVISESEDSLSSILKQNQLNSYIKYYEIKLVKIIWKMHKECLSAGSSLRSNGEAFNRISRSLDELRDSMILELRPGFKLMNKSLSEHDIYLINFFHIHFFTSLLLLNTAAETQAKKSKPSVHIHDKTKDYAMSNLQLVMEFKHYNLRLVLPEIFQTVVASSFQLIDKFIRSPLDVDSPSIIELLLRVRLLLSTNLPQISFQASNLKQFIDLFLIPSIQIFHAIHSTDINLKLNSMINDVLRENSSKSSDLQGKLSFASKVRTNEGNTMSLDTNLNHQIDQLFKEIDSNDLFSTWAFDSIF